VGKPEGNVPIGRPRCRWEDNIKTDLQFTVLWDMSSHILVYRVLVEKSEGKIPIGRPRCRWEDNIKTDLQFTVLWDVTVYFIVQGFGGET